MDITTLGSVATMLQPVGSITSMEDHLRMAYAQLHVKSDWQQKDILRRAHDPHTASSPEAVLGLQLDMAHHAIQTQVFSQGMKKATETIETLLKS
jgi:hypothetical protein